MLPVADVPQKKISLGGKPAAELLGVKLFTVIIIVILEL
jgi:hypothetical protein